MNSHMCQRKSVGGGGGGGVGYISVSYCSFDIMTMTRSQFML